MRNTVSFYPLLLAVAAGLGCDSSRGSEGSGGGGGQFSGDDGSQEGGSAGTQESGGAGGDGGGAEAGGAGGQNTGAVGGDDAGAGGSVAGGMGGAVNQGGMSSTGGAGTGGRSVPAVEPGRYGMRAQLLQANSEFAVAELDGKIYLLGGYPSSRVTQSTVMVYDIATDAWSYAAPLPVPIHHPVAVGVMGKLYSLGGQTDAGDIARTLVYDPAMNRWTDVRAMPTARGAGAAAVIGDRIYVVGGRPPAGNAFEVYDISDNTWSTLPNLPQAFAQRNHLIAAAIGGKIYVAGGRYNGGGFNSPMTASLDIYDPQMNAWSRGRDMLRPRGGVNGIAANGCFFVWGGEGTNTGEPNDVFPDNDVYNPITNAWMALRRLPTPVHGVTGSAFVGGLIYMPGGGTSSGGTSGSRIFQVYRPDVSCTE